MSFGMFPVVGKRGKRRSCQLMERTRSERFGWSTLTRRFASASPWRERSEVRVVPRRSFGATSRNPRYKILGDAPRSFA